MDRFRLQIYCMGHQPVISVTGLSTKLHKLYQFAGIAKEFFIRAQKTNIFPILFPLEENVSG